MRVKGLPSCVVHTLEEKTLPPAGEPSRDAKCLYMIHIKGNLQKSFFRTIQWQIYIIIHSFGKPKFDNSRLHYPYLIHSYLPPIVTISVFSWRVMKNWLSCYDNKGEKSDLKKTQATPCKFKYQIKFFCSKKKMFDII